ncbi:uncharacterized protein LOC102511494 [Camelus ferus]|uniref:Uncharacterized protein LOC102511494 n=1 Tax=Camelus ferus TaxID=419612 RepID=A0A8B8RCP2_CAMFR|nr:uncharacterized protein LOC102511494 [Camelus ferus]
MSAHNMSWIRYPSRVSMAVEEVIATQSVVSRCTLVYMALFLPLSLAAGLFNLTTFVRGRARLQGLDACLADLTATGLLVTLLSLTAIGRPDYLATTHLGCAVLSLVFNICYFNAQYVQVAMLSAFLLQRPSCLRAAPQGAQRPAASLAAIGGCAICSSLGVVALLGMSGELYEPTLCQVDPLTAWPEYEIVKVSLGLGLALVLKLVLLTLLGIRRAGWAAPPQGDEGSAHCWVVLAVTLASFACRLLYNTALVQRAWLKLRRDIGAPRDELLMNLAELALFGESCAIALATLLLHRPCRQALLSLLERLAQRCRRREAGNNFSLNRVGS